MQQKRTTLLPETVAVPLRQIGMDYDFPIWQDATDFLREKYFTHIIIYPQETATPPYYVFDFTIVSPYGANWETEKQYTDYYEALEDAIKLSVEGIRESTGAHGTE